MTGLQKYFVKEGSVAVLSEKAAVLPGDRESSALGVDTLLLDRCQRSLQGTHLDESEESNSYMELLHLGH